MLIIDLEKSQLMGKKYVFTVLTMVVASEWITNDNSNDVFYSEHDQSHLQRNSEAYWPKPVYMMKFV
jgi:hypothetical protein